jgi:hypothetical protein
MLSTPQMQMFVKFVSMSINFYQVWVQCLSMSIKTVYSSHHDMTVMFDVRLTCKPNVGVGGTLPKFIDFENQVHNFCKPYYHLDHALLGLV